MGWGSPEFVIIIVAVCTAGWLANNWIRARHGYALQDEWGGKTAHPSAGDGTLRNENAELRRRLAGLEQRTAALETIVTDGGYGVSREIEALRAERGIEAGRGIASDRTGREAA